MVTKTETLQDNFNDNSINTSKWIKTGGAQVVEVNQELELTTDTTTNFNGIKSVLTYELTGSYVHVKLVDPGNLTLTTHACILRCYITYQIRFQVVGNNSIEVSGTTSKLDDFNIVYTGLQWVGV